MLMDSVKDEKYIRELLRFHLRYSLAIQPEYASTHDWFTALALSTRNFLIDGIFATDARYDKSDAKRCYYLSMEFLMGRLLDNNLRNLGIRDIVVSILQEEGQQLASIEEAEADAALGNGGLGRLAACFLDSLASLDMPGYGYGINYEFGLFKQHIDNGYQKERPDHWLHEDTPWLLERPDDICVIPLYGRVEHIHNGSGTHKPVWTDWQVLIGVPFDMPVVGYGGHTVNYLRLYSARASNEFNIKIFNGGDYLKAVEEKIASENISKVLYPSDSCWGGKELRLVQEYFLVACALRDIITRYLKRHKDLNHLPDYAVMQLNDTHPSLTVAELMRILVDDYQMDWDAAWRITQASCAYTNHTLLPEALEKWPVSLFEKVLPRHLQIIYEINRRFLDMVAQHWPDDMGRQSRLSLVEEGWDKQIRMAHLAIVGSFSVNGVAAIHSELVKTRLVPDFYELWPERFNNKTNGVTPRRWLAQTNPGLAALLDDTTGSSWRTDLAQLKALEKLAIDHAFQDKFNQVKNANKQRLARIIDQTLQIKLDPDSLFDVQIKRIHEYKRQLLNILNVIHQYLRIVEDGFEPPVSKTYIFGGKAAPGYVMAKLIIKLINNVGAVINHDPRVRNRLKVVFMPDYRVSLAEKIIPAANLSEQISTAGTEASGTGNMKLAMNGALTVGTLDGANIEILEEVGAENIYIFGLTTEEVEKMRCERAYHPRDYYARYPFITRVLDSLIDTRFCPDEPGIFIPIVDMLLESGDYFFHLADLDAYRAIHETIAQDYNDTRAWTRKAILNVARMGKFSSDRTIQEYARDIWHIRAFPADASAKTRL
jgi:glycogen phosphorylase